MSLRDIGLKKSYDSDVDNIVESFLIPALSQSKYYYRLAGFFSSTSLAVSAKGITKFIENGGVMKLVCCPRFTKDDLVVIEENLNSIDKVLEKRLLNELENLEDACINDHLKVLAWLLANKRLEIKIAIVFNKKNIPFTDNEIQQNGIFHQKVGILEDLEGNKISFSGSDNESAFAWKYNIEEFKVFREWMSEEVDYLISDLTKFNKFWKEQAIRTKIVTLPEAVRSKIVKIAPNDIDDLNLERWYTKHPSFEHKKKVRLYDHQLSAVESWLNKNKKGIFEMATGTGKTFTALQCLKIVIENSTKLVTVITCPYHHLISQWDKSINNFGLEIKRIIADSTNPKWRKQIVDYILDIRNGVRDKLVILTSHSTFASSDFLNVIEKYASGKDIDLFLIADEVHGVGAETRKLGLLEHYQYRLGLSATPKRWFDDLGTQALYDFFNQVVYSFSLKDAIYTVNPDTGKTYLSPFEYKPIFVELSEDEIDIYIKETEKITKSYHSSRSEEEKEEVLKLLLFKRANIIKNAQNKIPALVQILVHLKEIKHTIIYCSPQQIETVRDLLREKNILFHKFTNEEGTKPEMVYGGLSERDYLLEKFADGDYKVLVAMRCLDEGVDIPPARIAIFMASSGNPREYIQRIGRVLRRFPNKEKAIIFDIIVIPTMNRLVSDYSEIEWKIIQNEIKRYEEIAGVSLNVAEVYDQLDKIIKRIKH